MTKLDATIEAMFFCFEQAKIDQISVICERYSCSHLWTREKVKEN
jgi:hypothetical protein